MASDAFCLVYFDTPVVLVGVRHLSSGCHYSTWYARVGTKRNYEYKSSNYTPLEAHQFITATIPDVIPSLVIHVHSRGMSNH